jgi:hypothetical protein
MKFSVENIQKNLRVNSMLFYVFCAVKFGGYLFVEVILLSKTGLERECRLTDFKRKTTFCAVKQMFTNCGAGCVWLSPKKQKMLLLRIP